jgi:hypothetical protein
VLVVPQVQQLQPQVLLRLLGGRQALLVGGLVVSGAVMSKRVPLECSTI